MIIKKLTRGWSVDLEEESRWGRVFVCDHYLVESGCVQFYDGDRLFRVVKIEGEVIIENGL
jgi:hypothetical protein